VLCPGSNWELFQQVGQPTHLRGKIDVR
jgi:hypothetical protein